MKDENPILSITHNLIFAMVGIIILCSFAIPILAPMMDQLSASYSSLVVILALIPMVLIVVLIKLVLTRSRAR